jgi:hypothetical protein
MFFGVFYSSILKADVSYYFQYNTFFSLNTKLEDERKNQAIKSISTYGLENMKGFYNANFILGVNLNSYFSTELDMANYDIAFTKDIQNNQNLTNKEADKSLTHVDYIIPTLVFNYLNLLNVDFYAKVGLGVGFINLSSSNLEGGNKPDFFYSASAGLLYNFTPHIGLNIGAQWVSNLATYQTLSTLGNIDVKIALKQLTTFFGIRFTL